MPTATQGVIDVELREMTKGHYVVIVAHSKFGPLYEIQIDESTTTSGLGELVHGIGIECIDRVNDVSVDINTLEDV
jgi:hypothetical protein